MFARLCLGHWAQVVIKPNLATAVKMSMAGMPPTRLSATKLLLHSSLRVITSKNLFTIPWLTSLWRKNIPAPKNTPKLGLLAIIRHKAEVNNPGTASYQQSGSTKMLLTGAACALIAANGWQQSDGARRLVKGSPEYLIRWEAFEEKDDTWEPHFNRAGMERDIADIEVRQKKESDELAAQLAAKRAKRKAAAAKPSGRANTSTSVASTLLSDATDLLPAAVDENPAAADEAVNVKLEHAMLPGRQTAKVWSATRLKETNSGTFKFQELLAGEKKCGDVLQPGGGAPAL
eukprot:2125110-Pleurochrysis_carterae.AAC.1